MQVKELEGYCLVDDTVVREIPYGSGKGLWTDSEGGWTDLRGFGGFATVEGRRTFAVAFRGRTLSWLYPWL